MQMSEGENFPNQEMHENKEMNNTEAKNTPENNKIQAQDKNIIENGSLKNEDLKIGQYYLTPLQSILLNKKFPMGFKLETEENIAKSFELTKIQEKKLKQAQKLNQQIGRRSSNKFGQTKKPSKNTNNFENIPNKIPPEKSQIYKQCKIGFNKIKESKYFNKYYTSNDPSIPCLSSIEKKINNAEYSSLYEFEMDVRNIWGHYFKLDPNDEVSQKMSEEWEKICTELENPNSELNVDNIKKRTDNLKKEVEKMKDHRKNTVPPPVKTAGQNSDNNTPMTVEEKNQLGNYIRSLNKEQLKGIIRILNDSDSYPKTKYFEFDIDKLPTKKLRDLEKYVKECININNKNSKNQNNQNANNKTQNMKENTINKNNTTNNANNTTQPQTGNLSTNQKNNPNKTSDAKHDMTPGKKSKQNTVKKTENKEESFSSDSMSSDSSLSG
jgi:hypothetical protein